jgi:hypothetical protein
VAVGFIGWKNPWVKTSAEASQAGRKSSGQQDGKEEKKKFWRNEGKENEAGRRQQNQTGGFTAYSE